jgi:glycosyltransferase involved in cell wall biosynthesis
MRRRLRIGLFGNVCNNLYQVAKALWRHTDFEAHLFIDSRTDLQQLPESDDPALLADYPAWIHKAPYVTAGAMAAPWRSRIAAELRDFDASIVSGFGPLFAQFTGRPFGFFVTGGDLTVYPFPWEFRFLYRSALWKAGSWPIGLWQARGIRRATEIWTQPYSPYVRALTRLRVDPSRVSPKYFPLVFDTSRFRPRDPLASEIGRQMRAPGRFVVFHPSRLMMRDHPSLRATGQWKRNEILIEGFARFALAHPERQPALVLLDRSASPDIPAARALISRLGIERLVTWMRPPGGAAFTRDDLLTLYSAADVVADDFGIGWFGGVALEALSVERPVLTYIDDAVMRRLYPSHPMLSADTPDAIAGVLDRLSSDPAAAARAGREGRIWVETYHSEATASRLYAEHITSMIDSRRLSGS